MRKSTLLIAMLFMIKFIMVFAEEEEDDIMGEIMVDLFIGAAMEVCSYYVTCSLIMSITFMAILILTLIGCVLGMIEPGDVVNSRNARRMSTHYIGRRLVRGYR